jgi:hypothetical protein
MAFRHVIGQSWHPCARVAKLNEKRLRVAQTIGERMEVKPRAEA